MKQKLVNLFNPALLPPKVALPAAWLPWTLVAGVVVCLAVMQWIGAQFSAASELAHSLQTQMVPLQAQTIELQKQLDGRKPDAKLQAENVQLEQRLQMRQQALAQLGKEGQVSGAGYTPQLLALAHQQNPGVWLTRIQFAADQLTLEGRTLSADKLPVWLEGLRKEHSFSGTGFSVFDIVLPAKDPLAKSNPDATYTFTLRNQREDARPEAKLEASGGKAP